VLDIQQRKDILSRGKPEPKGVPWWGESNLGAWYTEAEVEAIVRTVRESMDWTVGFGVRGRVKEVEEFENAFAEYCGTKYAVATNAGGTGIDISIMCLDLEPGDEVICPAINYKSAHLAIIKEGGKVVFCEIDPNTLNVDLEDVEKRITPRTRAIFPVHMNGLSAPMNELLDVAERYPHPEFGPLKVIGDAARACGAAYMGTKVGLKGWINIFSFQTQKHMTTLGEGGMITTDDPKVSARARDIRQFGGEEGWGSNYKMNKIQAVVGLVQLNRLDEMNNRRRQAAQRRSGLLKDVHELTLPYEPPNYEHVYYVYTILVPPDWAGEKRDRIIQILSNEFGIVCSVTNPPTYQRWSYVAANCGTPELKISEEVGQRIFCPPLHPLLNEEQELYICASLLETLDMVKTGA